MFTSRFLFLVVVFSHLLGCTYAPEDETSVDAQAINTSSSSSSGASSSGTSSRNEDNVSAPLVVVRNEAPVLQLVGDSTVYLELNDRYLDAGVIANDYEDGDISSHVTSNLSSLDTSVEGTFTITYLVKDSDLLSSANVKRTIVVSSAPQTSNKPSVALSWRRPTTREDDSPMDQSEISGYEILYRKKNDPDSIYMSEFTKGGKSTTAIIKGLTEDEYEFAVATIDRDGVYSDFSEQVVVSLFQ